MTSPKTQAELEALRASLVESFHKAKARDDAAEMERLTALIEEADDMLDDLAITGLQGLAAKLAELKIKVDEAARKAKSWPL